MGQPAKTQTTDDVGTPQAGETPTQAPLFALGTLDDWDAVPTTTKATTNQWDAAIRAVLDGQVLLIPATTEKDKHGIPIGIGRRASNPKGPFQVEAGTILFKYDAGRKRFVVRRNSDK